MGVTLVLNQVVGQAFVVKPSGELIQAKPNVQITTGDVISVAVGKNAWLVTEDQTQIDVLNDSLLVKESSLESLELPSDIFDIISDIEEGDHPIPKKGTKIADAKELTRSTFDSQTIIESNSNYQTLSASLFETSALIDNGLTEQQSDSLIRERFASILLIEEEYIPPRLTPISISTDENTDIPFNLDDILPFVTGGNSDKIQISNITSSQGGATIINNGDGSFVIRPPANFNGDMAFQIEVTDGITTLSNNATVAVNTQEDLPEIKLTTVPITEDFKSQKGAIEAKIRVQDGDNNALTFSISNLENNEFFTLDGKVSTQATVSPPMTRTDDDTIVDGEIVDLVFYPVAQFSQTLPETASETFIITAIDSNKKTTLNNQSIGADYNTLVLDNKKRIYEVDKSKVNSLNVGDQISNAIIVTATDASTHQIVNIQGSNDPSGAIKALGEGDSIDEYVRAQTSDGTESEIKITLEGINDTVIFSAINTREITGSDNLMHTSGRINVDDSDSGESLMRAETVEGNYGTLEIDLSGDWTYTLDPDLAQFLDEGVSLIDTLIIEDSNGDNPIIKDIQLSGEGKDTLDLGSTSRLSHNEIITDTTMLTASDAVTQTQVNVIIGDSENAFQGSGSLLTKNGLETSTLTDLIALDEITQLGNDEADKILGESDVDVMFGEQGSNIDPTIDQIADFDTQNDALNLSNILQNETLESFGSYLSFVDDAQGNTMLNISSNGDGNIDQQIVFENLSLEGMASAYDVDISGMTSEQISSSVIEMMVMQSKMIID